ncbi:hypothetical protein [Mesorhizobium sp. IMUNJ 23232]|uniref:hypothetical protein n=1 Tax=Mesorhizobium sp. IMUNJ 23232 TaxID=3376064 RepID=UPI0037AE0541
MPLRFEPFPDFDSMREGMRPQPVPGLPGVSAWASFAAMRRLSDATGINDPGQLLAELLRGNSKVIQESVSHVLIHDADKSAFVGFVDDVPVPLMPLGRLLADAVHRRLFGEGLEGGSDD